LEAAAPAPEAPPLKQQRKQCEPPREPPPPPPPSAAPPLRDARRGLEEAVASLLRTRKEERVADELAVPPPPLEAAVKAKAEPASREHTFQALLGDKRSAPPTLETLEELWGYGEGKERNGGSWIEEAFGDLVRDLVPAGAEAAGGSNSWITEAFVALIDDEPAVPGGWVAEAFGKLVGSSQPPQPRRLVGALLSPDPNEPGSWIAEAFSTLVKGCRTPMPAKWRRPRASEPPPLENTGGEQQQLGWVAEALRALTAGTIKRQGERPAPTSAISTPRSLSHTPRHIGDALQRLRSMGGWAWVAFA